LVRLLRLFEELQLGRVADRVRRRGGLPEETPIGRYIPPVARDGEALAFPGERAERLVAGKRQHGLLVSDLDARIWFRRLR
jgi:hypothetical protein